MKLMVAHYQAAVGGLCSGRRRPRACPRHEGGLSSFWAGHSLSVHTTSAVASLHIFHSEGSSLKLGDWQPRGKFITPATTEMNLVILCRDKNNGSKYSLGG